MNPTTASTLMSRPRTAGPLTAGTKAATEFLERLAEELDVPQTRYDQARSRYKSVAEWLNREASQLKDYAPDVYVQGSFRLGTPIRPVNEDEHYDVDLVCELTIEKTALTQERFKQLLGDEMQLYAAAHGMQDISEGRRCWILDYADGAQFHLDALPAIPDAARKRLLLEARGLDTTWADTAIAISDRDHPNYRRLSDQWPHSNPKGYTKWFRSRMEGTFKARREAMALQARASIEDIPSYRVKTPLQEAVQLLKRHRDVMFADDPEHKPISVIITTLSGLSYENEATVAAALAAILSRMETHIKVSPNGDIWIANPTDPSENFADRWVQHPCRKENFFRWLERARADFADLLRHENQQRLFEVASTAVGVNPARKAVVAPRRQFTLVALLPELAPVLTAAHRLAPPWPVFRQGAVRIAKTDWMANGFSRWMHFDSDGPPLPKSASLRFEAQVTGVSGPVEVYWQVVNSGAEAAARNGLRGGFDRGSIEQGTVKHRESTSYSGTHTIECLVVKDRYLVARSGPFVVNIR